MRSRKKDGVDLVLKWDQTASNITLYLRQKQNVTRTKIALWLITFEERAFSNYAESPQLQRVPQEDPPYI